MNVRTGVDLIEVDRIRLSVERYGNRFLRRVFTERELAEAADSLPSLAARFSAKEAVSKALGTGIGDITWQEIEILHGPRREPCIHLHGAAASMAKNLNLEAWSISLSHTRDYAIAVVVGAGS
jgi:holo-[acyl-carrier protein] synthase